MYSLDDFILFLKVVQVKGISKASKILKIDRTQLSRRISILEQNLGVSLIQYNAKEFRLTDVGQDIGEFLSTEHSFLDIKREIDKIINKKQQPKWTLNVVLPPVLSLKILDKYLLDFLTKYPKINLNLFYSNKEFDLVNDGVDVAIANYMPSQQYQKIKHIYTMYGKLYCTKEYAEIYGYPKKPSEVKDHLITGYFDNQLKPLKQVAARNTKTGEVVKVSLVYRLTTNSETHNLNFLKSNKIICAAFENNTNTLNHFDLNDIVPILPDWTFMELKFYLLRNPYNNSHAVDLFYDFISDVFADLPA